MCKDPFYKKNLVVLLPTQETSEGISDEENSPSHAEKTFNSTAAPGGNDHTQPSVDGEQEDLEDNFRCECVCVCVCKFSM